MGRLLDVEHATCILEEEIENMCVNECVVSDKCM